MKRILQNSQKEFIGKPEGGFKGEKVSERSGEWTKGREHSGNENSEAKANRFSMIKNIKQSDTVVTKSILFKNGKAKIL